MTYDEPDGLPTMARGYHQHIAQHIALAALLGLPGLLIIGAGLSWLGDLLPRLYYWVLSLSPFVGPKDYHPEGWYGGATRGIYIAAMAAGLYLLVWPLIWLSESVALYRKRDSISRPAHPDLFERLFWWLPEFNGNPLYDRLAKHFLLRWWHYGVPIGSRTPTGLVPHPRDWDSFLDWASHRGYLRHVGDQYVWMHETLRIWFGRYLDAEALATLGK